MSETLPRMTEAEYLAWEAGQDRPYAFDGFRPLALTGGTASHERIQVNDLMIEQTSALVTVITRAGDLWAIDVLRGGETLRLPAIDVELAVDDLHDGLDLPPEEP